MLGEPKRAVKVINDYFPMHSRVVYCTVLVEQLVNDARARALFLTLCVYSWAQKEKEKNKAQLWPKKCLIGGVFWDIVNDEACQRISRPQRRLQRPKDSCKGPSPCCFERTWYLLLSDDSKSNARSRWWAKRWELQRWWRTRGPARRPWGIGIV